MLHTAHSPFIANVWATPIKQLKFDGGVEVDYIYYNEKTLGTFRNFVYRVLLVMRGSHSNHGGQLNTFMADKHQKQTTPGRDSTRYLFL